jgi:gas vesicle protein
MDYDDNGAANFLAGLVAGAVIGAGVALVLAPDSGKKTRKRIHRAADDLRETATDRWDEIADEVRDRVEEALAGAKKRIG